MRIASVSDNYNEQKRTRICVRLPLYMSGYIDFFRRMIYTERG